MEVYNFFRGRAYCGLSFEGCCANQRLTFSLVVYLVSFMWLVWVHLSGIPHLKFEFTIASFKKLPENMNLLGLIHFQFLRHLKSDVDRAVCGYIYRFKSDTACSWNCYQGISGKSSVFFPKLPWNLLLVANCPERHCIIGLCLVIGIVFRC